MKKDSNTPYDDVMTHVLGRYIVKEPTIHSIVGYLQGL